MILGQVHRLVRRILESKNKIVFVSHPFSNDPEGNKEKVNKICKKLFNEGKIPLSPLHMFSYMSDDRHRKAIILICKSLMVVSTECLFYMYEELSEGQKIEIDYAGKIGKPVRVIEV